MVKREKIFNKKQKELITIQEAQELGYGLADTFKMRIHAKTLDAIKVGRSWLVVKDDVKKQNN